MLLCAVQALLLEDDVDVIAQHVVGVLQGLANRQKQSRCVSCIAVSPELQQHAQPTMHAAATTATAMMSVACRNRDLVSCCVLAAWHVKVT